MADFQWFGKQRDSFFTGHLENLIKHVCPPTFGGGPLDPRTANVPIERGLLVGFDMPLPPFIAARLGNTALPMWIIEDPNAAGNLRRTYPSPLVRTKVGDTVHALVKGKGGTHTIHWHGIEPTPCNDGVGKHSFEVSGNFVYQFMTNEAGTYFYHCHKNTTLHFHMGLWGGLIVDPLNPETFGADDNELVANGLGFSFETLQAPYVQTFASTIGNLRHSPGYVAGRRQFFSRLIGPGNVIPYHHERIWAVDSLDSFWHLFNPNHNHNMQKCDNADPNNPANFHQYESTAFDLNKFNPDVFTVSGVVMDSPATVPPFTGTIEHPDIAIAAKKGEFVLVRYINASYTIQDLTFEDVTPSGPLPLPVEAFTVIAWDGHPLGLPGFHAFSSPYNTTGPIRTTAARRMDIIIDTNFLTPDRSYVAKIKSYDWIKTGFQFAEITIPITIGEVQPPQADTITVTRARFNPRNRRLEVQATSSLGLAMTATAFGPNETFGPFDLVNGRLRVTLPPGENPNRVVVSSAQGTSGDVTIVVR